MTIKNPYRKNTKLSRQKTLQIIEFFKEDSNATFASRLLKLERNTVNNWYNYFREIIYDYSEKEKKEKLWWIMELDESYFWPKRIRWKRWRWAWKKIIVFWILKRNNQVYTEIVPNCAAKTLLPIIRWKIDKKDSTINSDWWRAYDWLVDMWYKKHYRVHHSKNEFARWAQHVNWIESFWSFTKRRMNKFNWIRKDRFNLHLKESEFRFNCRLWKKDIKEELIKLLKLHVKSQNKIIKNKTKKE